MAFYMSINRWIGEKQSKPKKTKPVPNTLQRKRTDSNDCNEDFLIFNTPLEESKSQEISITVSESTELSESDKVDSLRYLAQPPSFYPYNQYYYGYAYSYLVS